MRRYNPTPRFCRMIELRAKLYQKKHSHELVLDEPYRLRVNEPDGTVQEIVMDVPYIQRLIDRIRSARDNSASKTLSSANLFAFKEAIQSRHTLYKDVFEN